MFSKKTARWICLSGMLSCATLVHAFAELSHDQFQSLHQQLQPAENEPWLTIPWKIELLDAQRAAAKQGKPIFIWAMDGHPLGCT